MFAFPTMLMKRKWKWKSLSHIWLFVTPRTINPWNSAGQITGVGSLFPSPGNLPNPGIKPRSPSLQVDSLPAEPQGKPTMVMHIIIYFVVIYLNFINKAKSKFSHVFVLLIRFINFYNLFVMILLQGASLYQK